MQSLVELIEKIGRGAGRVVGVLYQAGRNAVDQVITTVLPFMVFIALLIGIILKTGIGTVIARGLTPLASNLVGLIVLSVVCTLPFLSPILGPGAVIAQIIGTLIGVEIGRGNVPPSMALPALYAINQQAGMDFIPVGLSMAEASEETIELGVPACLFARQIMAPVAVVIGWLFSFGMRY